MQLGVGFNNALLIQRRKERTAVDQRHHQVGIVAGIQVTHQRGVDEDTAVHLQNGNLLEALQLQRHDDVGHHLIEGHGFHPNRTLLAHILTAGGNGQRRHQKCAQLRRHTAAQLGSDCPVSHHGQVVAVLLQRAYGNDRQLRVKCHNFICGFTIHRYSPFSFDPENDIFYSLEALSRSRYSAALGWFLRMLEGQAVVTSPHSAW